MGQALGSIHEVAGQAPALPLHEQIGVLPLFSIQGGRQGFWAQFRKTGGAAFPPKPADIQGNPDLSDGKAKAGPQIRQAAAPPGDPHPHRPAALPTGLQGHHVHHAQERVVPVEAGSRPSDDLDAVDAGQGNGEILPDLRGTHLRRAVEGMAVQEHQ